MQNFSWVETWQALGFIFGTAIVAIATKIGVSKSSGRPPPERTGETQELQHSLHELRTRLDRVGLDDASATQLRRSIDALCVALDRNTTACVGISSHMSTVNHAIEALAKEMEFSSRMGRRHE